MVKTTTTKPFADLIEDPTVDEMEGERPHHEVEQDDESQNEWTFSLNQEEVVIQFTDSVTKVKGSHNV